MAKDVDPKEAAEMIYTLAKAHADGRAAEAAGQDGSSK